MSAAWIRSEQKGIFLFKRQREKEVSEMVKLKKNKQLYFHVWAASLMGMSYGEYMAFITDPVMKLSKNDFNKLVRAYYKDHKEDFVKETIGPSEEAVKK